MSTVAEEITRISGCREDIKTAIAAKGVTVPATAKLADCPALIASITGGGGSVDSFINTGFTASGEYTYTRAFTATQKIVPVYDITTAGITLSTGSTPELTFSIPDTSVFPLTGLEGITFTGAIQAWTSIPSTGTVGGTEGITGSWTAVMDGTNFTATAMFSANNPSTPTDIKINNVMGFGIMTIGQPVTATIYTQTGTTKPYPQYPDSTEGTMDTYVSGNENWRNVGLGYAAMTVISGNYNTVYNNGPSISMTTADEQGVITFSNGNLRSFVVDRGQGITNITDTGYTYSYGNITSGYTGFTGM